MKKLCFILVLAMLVSVFAVGCSNPNEDTKDTTTATDAAGNTGNPSVTTDPGNPSATTDPGVTVSDIEKLDPNLPARTEEQREVVIVGRENVGSYLFAYDEINADGGSADSVSSAVFSRNSIIEEKYNIIIVPVNDTISKVTSLVENEVKNNGDAYDIVMPMTNQAFSMAVNGYLTNFDDLYSVNCEKEYWMSNVFEATSIGNINYFCPGDTNISAFNTVGVTFFNKVMVNSNQLDSPYELVDSGNWTFQKLSEMCEIVTSDDGDSIMNENDTYGLNSNSFAWQPFFYGMGQSMIKKNSEDIPELTVDENTFDVLTDVVKIFNDNTKGILVNQYENLKSEDGGWGDASIRLFSSNKALFWVEIIYGAPRLKEMTSDFGIVPMPKRNDKQTDYVSYIHVGHSSVMAVPTSASDIDLCAALLEDMAYQSFVKVRPVFYDTVITTKNVRDEESHRMLKTVYKNITVDLALVMSSAGLKIDDTMRNQLINGKINFKTMFESLGPGYNLTIDSIVDKYLSH